VVQFTLFAVYGAGDMLDDKGKWISIMVVPEDGAGLRKWRITSRRFMLLKALFVFTCIFIVVGFFSMITLTYMIHKVRQYRIYNAQLYEATAKLEGVAERLASYEEKERKLRMILGGDIEVPESLTDADIDAAKYTMELADNKDTDEFNQALVKQEARMRRVPSIWPVKAWQVSKGFVNSDREVLIHHGIDMLAPKNSNVVATGDGKVTFAGRDDRLGNMITIDHGQSGWMTQYGHVKKILVKDGEYVKKGQTIAVFGGVDAASTGAHLHYAIYHDGVPIDPMVLLRDTIQYDRIAQDR